MKLFLKTRNLINLSYLFFFIGYLASWVSLYISPNTIWLAGPLCFFLPVFFFINILWIPVLFFSKVITKWISLTGLFPGIFIIPLCFGLHSSSNTPDNNQPGTIKLLSYNTSGYIKGGSVKETAAVESWIAREKFDIICLQEYFPELKTIYVRAPKGNMQKRKVMVSYLGEIFPHTYFHRQGNMMGVATFSQYPITESGVVFSGEKKHNKGIYSDILIGNEELRIINVHLESNLLKWSTIFSSDFLIAFKVFIRNQQIRSLQAEKIAAFVKHTNKRIILTGDFNETQFSYAYFLLKDLLKNSFEEKGEGIGSTYRPEDSFLRIDHQFHSESLKLKDFRIMNEVEFSDHVPLQSFYIIE